MSILFLWSIHKALYGVKWYYQLCIHKYLQMIKWVVLNISYDYNVKQKYLNCFWIFITLIQLFLHLFHFADVTHNYKKKTILIFWTKFDQKIYFLSKTRETNIAIEFNIFKLFWWASFILNRQFWLFGPKLPPKKFEHHHWIHLKQSILIFWTKFAQKGYFQTKSEKINITIKWLYVLVMSRTLSEWIRTL